MENSYQLGPVSISKSFVNQPLFWPTIMGGLLVVAGVWAVKTGRLSFTSKPPEPTIMAKVFPLNQQLSKPILYASGTTIFRTNGQSEEKMFEVGSEVLSLVPSADGSKLAATYKSPNGGLNAAGYPYTSLIFYDMNTRKSLPLIAQNNTTVRYASWSDDNRYISFWVNDGAESFIYDTTRRKAIYSVKRDQTPPVSPIVFLPGSTGIVYIKNGTVFSAGIDGSRPIALAEQARSTYSLNGGVAASAPMISPSGMYIAYKTLADELAVVNTTTREVKIVEPTATALGFLNNESLLYSLQSKEKGTSLHKYSLTDNASTDVKNPMHKGVIESAVVLSKQSRFFTPSLYPDNGPQLITEKGQIEKDCSQSDFSFTYKNSDDTRLSQSTQVVSPDGKYVLGSSDGSMAVLDTTDCQPYIIANVKPAVATWSP
jgi:hypothetical protein